MRSRGGSTKSTRPDGPRAFTCRTLVVVDVMAGEEKGQLSNWCRVCLTVLPHFGTGSIVEQHIRVSIAQLAHRVSFCSMNVTR